MPVAPKPIVESTVITDDPILIVSITLVLPVTSNVPVINSSSLYPTKISKVKYSFIEDVPVIPVNTSTSEIEAVVCKSVDLNIVCPCNLRGSPDIFSATILSRLKYFAEDGFTKYFSRSITFGVTPYKTLNKILKDSSVPFAS